MCTTLDIKWEKIGRIGTDFRPITDKDDSYFKRPHVYKIEYSLDSKIYCYVGRAIKQSVKTRIIYHLRNDKKRCQIRMRANLDKLLFYVVSGESFIRNNVHVFKFDASAVSVRIFEKMAISDSISKKHIVTNDDLCMSI